MTVRERTAGRLVAGPVLLASVVLALGGAGAVELGWSWTLALVCVCFGVVLVASAPPSRALFVGAFARLAATRRALWSLRGATIVTAPLAGAGPVAYALLALGQALIEPRPLDARPDWRSALGTVLVGLGFVLAAIELGLSIGSEPVLWSVLAGATGLSGFWWLSGPAPAARLSLAGAALLITLLWGATTAGEIDGLVLAGIAGALVAALVFGPRWLRSSRAAAAERARAARVEERAEVAGAVHDSVLQTLALIQSRADDSAEVRALARSQERDLRARLFDEGDPAARPTSVATALRAATAEIEDAHRVKVDVVTVGDSPLDERTQALVAAAREALLNAVRHAEGTPVSLFAEVENGRVEAYVRDRGPGFDLESVPADRRGVTDSIVARMVRHGGHAVVRTAPGGGCEVRLVMEREP